MKDWETINKIKELNADGMGLSMRQIAKDLNLSRNTVKKCVNLSIAQIASELAHAKRIKKLDLYAKFIIEMLEKESKLTSVDLKHLLENKFGKLDISDRTLRRYVARIKNSQAYTN